MRVIGIVSQLTYNIDTTDIELALESSLLFKLLSLCFPCVSLEGAGITGSISYSSIRAHAVTRRMGLSLAFFTWCP